MKTLILLALCVVVMGCGEKRVYVPGAQVVACVDIPESPETGRHTEIDFLSAAKVVHAKSMSPCRVWWITAKRWNVIVSEDSGYISAAVVAEAW